MSSLAEIDGKKLPLQVPPSLSTMKKDELVVLITRMAEDFRMLNAIHNNRADDHGWCGEYEERQERYNEKLHVFRLAARPGRGSSRSTGHTGMPGQGL
jgi:hypothetical protein